MLTRENIKCLVIETRLDHKLAEHELSCLKRSMQLREDQLVAYDVLNNPLEIGLEKDYQAMQNMIFGTKPTFDEIIETLKTLEQEIAIKRTNNNNISNQTDTDKPRRPDR